MGFGLGRLRKSNSTFSIVCRSNFIPCVEYNSQTILFAYIILINCVGVARNHREETFFNDTIKVIYMRSTFRYRTRGILFLGS